MQYYENLKVIRNKYKKSQKEISEVLNTTQQQYCKYEKGIQELPIRHLITLSEYYCISCDELLGINTYININRDNIMFNNKVNTLSEKNKKLVFDLISAISETNK